MIRIENPWIFGWAIVFVIGFLIVRAKSPTPLRLPFALSFRGSTITQYAQRTIQTLLWIAFASFVAWSAQIRGEDVVSVTTTRGRDIMIALDTSYSMLADDLSPNRLLAAKKILQDFVQKMQGNRVGIVVFAGKAVTFVPPTDDLGFVQKNIETLTFDSLDQCSGRLYGTNIGFAIALAAKNLLDIQTPDRDQAIVLITDGGKETKTENLSLAALRKKNIFLSTVGIGQESGVTLNALFPCTGTPFPESEKNVVLNTALLRSIAQEGDGIFLQTTNNQELASVLLEKLDFLRAGNLVQQERRPQSYDLFFALLGTISLGGALLCLWKYPLFS